MTALGDFRRRRGLGGHRDYALAQFHAQVGHDAKDGDSRSRRQSALLSEPRPAAEETTIFVLVEVRTSLQDRAGVLGLDDQEDHLRLAGQILQRSGRY